MLECKGAAADVDGAWVTVFIFLGVDGADATHIGKFLGEGPCKAVDRDGAGQVKTA